MILAIESNNSVLNDCPKKYEELSTNFPTALSLYSSTKSNAISTGPFCSATFCCVWLPVTRSEINSLVSGVAVFIIE